jgi:hypothetical protein
MIAHLDIEWLCVQEFVRLALRNSRYLALILPMYGRTLNYPRRAQLLRCTYCLARILDDMLDGDMPCPADPEYFVRTLIHQARTGVTAGDGVAGKLASHVFTSLGPLASPIENPAEQFQGLVQLMLFDHSRADRGLLLTSRQLEEHHRQTFSASLNVTLTIAGARTRATDIPEIIRAQSTLYTIRDLEVDLGRGLINIPSEVVAEARLEGAPPVPHLALLSTVAVKTWIAEELERGRHSVEAAGRLLERREMTGWGLERSEAAGRVPERRDDREARWVLQPLYRGLYHLSKRLLRASMTADPATWPRPGQPHTDRPQ